MLKKIDLGIYYIINVFLVYLALEFFYKGYIAEGFLCAVLIVLYNGLNKWEDNKAKLGKLEAKCNDSKIKDVEINALKAEIASDDVLIKSQDILLRDLQRQIVEYRENEKDFCKLIETLAKYAEINSLENEDIDKVINLVRKQLINLDKREEELN